MGTAVNATNLIYDDNGNLTNHNGWAYGYDYENRMTTAANGTTTANYSYDPFGRRITKTVDGVSTTFLYDGDQIIAEYDTTGALQKKYIFGSGIDEPISLITNGHDHYYSFDNLGSVISLTDSSGVTVEEYAYDVFGNTQIKDAEGNILTASAVGNTYAYTSRELDNETGLYYYRERYYLPELGRFLQTDPLQLDDENTYAYCNNNSANYTDPYGLIAYAAVSAKNYSDSYMLNRISFNGFIVSKDISPRVLNGKVKENDDDDTDYQSDATDPIPNDLAAKKNISTKGAPKLPNYGNLTLSAKVSQRINKAVTRIKQTFGDLRERFSNWFRGWKTDIKWRKRIGEDGSRSRMVITRDSKGKVVNVRHEVFKRGIRIHRD